MSRTSRSLALGLLGSFALGMAGATAAEGPQTCIADTTTLCLSGRFAAKVTWGGPDESAQAATAVPITDSSGYFWFFDASNVEFVVKVVDGCAINNSWWVFGTPMTSLGWTLEVTDTVTGDYLCWGCFVSELPPPKIAFETDVFRACP